MAKTTKNTATDTSEELVSVMSKFHKDFRNRSEKMLGYMKYQHDTLLEQTKRAKLSSVSNISNISTTNISNINNAATTNLVKPLTKQMVESNDVNKEKLDKLTKATEVQTQEGQKQHKESKSLFKNAMFQMRIFDAVVDSIKMLLRGPSATERIVNAVNNVENAVLKKARVDLDERSVIQKLIEGENGILDLFPELKNAMSAVNIDAEGFKGNIETVFNTFKTYAKGGISSIKTTTGDLFSNITDMLSKGDVKKKVEKSGKEFSFNLMSVLDKMMGKAMNEQFTKSKGFTFSSLFLFGDATNAALSTGLMKPLDTLTLAAKGFKFALLNGIRRPLYQTIPVLTERFGAMGIGIGLFLKALRPLDYFFTVEFTQVFKDFGKTVKGTFGIIKKATIWLAKDMISPLTDGFKKIRRVSTKIKESATGLFTNIFDTIKEKSEGWTKPFKKKMGKTMLGLGAWLGLKGVGMLGIMGTIMTVGMAALPVIIGAAVVSAITAAGLYIYNNWDTVKEKWYEYVVYPFTDMLWNLSQTIGNKVTEIKTKISSTFTSIFTYIKDAIINGARAILPDSVVNSVFGATTTATDVTGSVVPVSKIDKATNEKVNSKNEELVELQKKQLKQTELMNSYLARIEGKETPTALPSTTPDDAQTMVLTQ